MPSQHLSFLHRENFLRTLFFLAFNELCSCGVIFFQTAVSVKSSDPVINDRIRIILGRKDRVHGGNGNFQLLEVRFRSCKLLEQYSRHAQDLYESAVVSAGKLEKLIGQACNDRDKKKP